MQVTTACNLDVIGGYLLAAGYSAVPAVFLVWFCAQAELTTPQINKLVQWSPETAIRITCSYINHRIPNIAVSFHVTVVGQMVY